MKHTCAAVFIVFLLFFSVSLFLYTGQLKKITSAGFLMKTFEQSGLYTNLPGIISESLKDSPNNAAVQALSNAVDPTYFRTQIQTNLPPFIKYLNGKSKTLNVNLDLKPFKAAILKQAPAEAVTSIPDNYTLNQESANANNVFRQAKRSFHVLNLAFLISGILSLLLIGVLVLMGKSFWPSILRWTGFALLLPAALQLIIVIIGKASLNPAIKACVAKASPTMANLLKPVIAVFANNIFNVTMLYAGIVFFISLVLIVLSYIFHSHKEVQSAQQLPR